MLPVIQAADQAEVRGDPAGALDVILSRLFAPDGSVFWRPERVRQLSQLCVLGPLLPRWATSRWVLSQALQVLDQPTRGRSRTALSTAVRVGSGSGTLPGVDQLDANARVVDHDWVYRQLFLYELGGLDHFVRRIASPDLLAGADRIGEWAAAPMGAYLLVEETPRELAWEDLATGRDLRTINLGAATLTPPGYWALGRVVPTDEGAMFESAPLAVPEGAALDVARDRAGWVDAVAKACREEYPLEDDEPCITGGFDFGLLTDVPGVTQHYLQHLVTGAPHRDDPEGCDRPSLSADFVRAAMGDELELLDLGVSPWPSVAAALVEPNVSDQLLRNLTPADAEALRGLGARLPEPASSVCETLADILRAVA